MSTHLDMIINAVGDPIFVKDRQLRFVLINDALCRFVGHSRETLMGKTGDGIFPKEQMDVFREKDEETFRTGQ
jgi:two-component system NtrC family sensor kinase